MIQLDNNNKIINVTDDISMDELAVFLAEEFPFEDHDYKIVIHGSDEETDIEW